jgi:hypothetical protein
MVGMTTLAWSGRKECSFLKKRTKKLLFPVGHSPERPATAGQKFFASFFQKRRPSFSSV